MPESQARNTVRVAVHLLPADLAGLDALARDDAEPGMAGNRSKTVRDLVRDELARRANATARKRKKRPVPR